VNTYIVTFYNARNMMKTETVQAEDVDAFRVKFNDLYPHHRGIVGLKRGVSINARK